MHGARASARPDRFLATVLTVFLALAAGTAAALKPSRTLTQYGHDIWQVGDSLPQNTVNAIVQSRDGHLWLGTQRGVARFNGVDFAVLKGNRTMGLGHNYVLALCEGHDGSLWIGTYGGGLSRFKDGTFATHTTASGLPDDTVRAMLEDRTGALWIGTHGGGFNRLKDGAPRSFTADAGLPDDVILAILEDSRGHLWMSSLKRTFRVSKEQLDEIAAGRRSAVTPLVFGKADGMRTTECTEGSQPSSWRTQDGRLWFRTLKGVAVVDPERLNLVQDPPPVTIQELVVDNVAREIRSGMQLPSGSGHLEFHYNTVSLLNPRGVSFRFRLVGFDSTWVYAGSRRIAYYAKLPPGRYTFEVAASRNDGPWNTNVAAFPFSIEPRFYQTTWFFGVCGIAVLLVGLGGHRLRIRRTAARRTELSQLVAERTKQLEEANALLGERTRQLEEANQRLELLSSVDSLTEVANRRQFDRVLDAEWRRCARTGLPLALLMLDIDHFKPYNDGYGHVTGDACLRNVAAVLQHLVQRAGEMVARYGGEEFAVMLPGSDATHARELAENIRLEVELLAIPHAYSGVAPVVTLSAGVSAMIPIYGNMPGDLVAAADRALYHAKQAGRNRVALIPPA